VKINPKHQQLLDELRRGLELDRTDKAASLKVFQAVAAEARRLGLDSAYARWLVAVTHDERGELEMAWEEIEASLAADPLSLPARHSFELIAGRVRASLAAPEREAADPSTPRLYALLQRANEADLGSHLAMGRWQLATGRAAEARELGRAVVKLYPASREAWALLAAAARALGDDLTATAAEAEAAGAAAAEPLFGVFGQARA